MRGRPRVKVKDSGRVNYEGGFVEEDVCSQNRPVPQVLRCELSAPRRVEKQME